MNWNVALLFCIVVKLCNALDPQESYAGESLSNVFRAIEENNNIPRHLLEAIAIGESSKNFKVDEPPFPLAVSVNGKSRYFVSKEEAVKAVRELIESGVKNIDVGCMQINLSHHPKAFNSLEEAFDPVCNISYAAKFLKDLRMRSSSWVEAMSRYHSWRSVEGEKYKQKIFNIWNNLRKKYYSSIAKEGLTNVNTCASKKNLIFSINDIFY